MHNLQRGIGLAPGRLRAASNFKVVGDDFSLTVFDHEVSTIAGGKTGARRHDRLQLCQKRLFSELRLVLWAEPMDQIIRRGILLGDATYWFFTFDLPQPDQKGVQFTPLGLKYACKRPEHPTRNRPLAGRPAPD
jgi:hypothetical protein